MGPACRGRNRLPLPNKPKRSPFKQYPTLKSSRPKASQTMEIRAEIRMRIWMMLTLETEPISTRTA